MVYTTICQPRSYSIQTMTTHTEYHANNTPLESYSRRLVTQVVALVQQFQLQFLINWSQIIWDKEIKYLGVILSM